MKEKRAAHLSSSLSIKPPWDKLWVSWLVQNILMATLCDGFKIHKCSDRPPCRVYVSPLSILAGFLWGFVSLIHHFILCICPLGFLLSPSQPPFYPLCCCSVTKSCPTLCDPMDCSTPGFPVLRCLPEFAQTHVLWVGDAIQPSHPLLPPLLLPSIFSHHQGLFQWVSSSLHVAKVLDSQLQHQSFQWMFRVDFL